MMNTKRPVKLGVLLLGKRDLRFKSQALWNFLQHFVRSAIETILQGARTR